MRGEDVVREPGHFRVALLDDAEYSDVGVGDAPADTFASVPQAVVRGA